MASQWRFSSKWWNLRFRKMALVAVEIGERSSVASRRFVRRLVSQSSDSTLVQVSKPLWCENGGPLLSSQLMGLVTPCITSVLLSPRLSFCLTDSALFCSQFLGLPHHQQTPRVLTSSPPNMHIYLPRRLFHSSAVWSLLCPLDRVHFHRY